MDEKRAAEILKNNICEDGLKGSDDIENGVYMRWSSGHYADKICLDSDFSAEQLEAIAWWIRNKRIN